MSLAARPDKSQMLNTYYELPSQDVFSDLLLNQAYQQHYSTQTQVVHQGVQEQKREQGQGQDWGQKESSELMNLTGHTVHSPMVGAATAFPHNTTLYPEGTKHELKKVPGA
jgi:hypothetical protein